MTTTSQDKRRRILDAAVTVFAENGFYNAKVAQVAKEAGVADGTIYLYFKNKEDILIQVFMDAMEDILKRQMLILGDIPDPKEKLKAFIYTHFSAVSKSRAMAEVVTVELRQSAKFMRQTDMKPFGRYLGLIAGIVEEGIQKGMFQEQLDPRLTARAIFGAIDELALAWAMSNRTSTPEEAANNLCQLFLSGLNKCPDHLR